MKICIPVLALLLAVGSLDAEPAWRLGASASGRQSSAALRDAQRPAQPASPARNRQAAPSQQGTAAAAGGAVAAPKRPWGGMLGGLAAGLGLAWLASSLGLGEAFGQFMLVALLVLAGMGLVGWFLRSRRPLAPSSPYAFQAAGSAQTAQAPRQYSPDNVGNDASARPWERNAIAFEASRPQQDGGAQVASALAGSRGWGVPHGFDTAAFLDAAKRNFITLQEAWDRSDIPTLRSMMTDGMLTEIQSQLAQREVHLAGQANKTDVVMLESQLLGIEDLGNDYMASVEFSGMIREQPSAGPTPFREVWNMTKPKSGTTGWLVAGVQALQ